MPKLLRLVHITHIYIGDKLQELLDLTLKGGGSAMSDSLGRLEPSQEFDTHRAQMGRDQFHAIGTECRTS
ncbi:unnamed protein product [Sphagnum balticum]